MSRNTAEQLINSRFGQPLADSEFIDCRRLLDNCDFADPLREKGIFLQGFGIFYLRGGIFLGGIAPGLERCRKKLAKFGMTLGGFGAGLGRWRICLERRGILLAGFFVEAGWIGDLVGLRGGRVGLKSDLQIPRAKPL